MTTRLQRRRVALPQPFWMRSIAMLCLVLAAVVGSVEAVHIHGQWLPKNDPHVTLPADASQGQGEEHCPLCVAMHSTLPATIQTAPHVALAKTQLVQTRALAAPHRLWSFAMFSRPPPAAVSTHVAGAASNDVSPGVAVAGGASSLKIC